MNRKTKRLIFVGTGILCWLLSFPFYGPLLFTILPEAMGFAYPFAAGHALGLVAAGLWPLEGKTGVLPFSLVAVLFSLLGLLRPVGIIGVLLPFGAGLAAAQPVIAWALALAGHSNPRVPFTAALILANLWCWVACLSLLPPLPWVNLAVASSAWLASSWVLRVEKFPRARNPVPVAFFWPLFLFIVAAYVPGGVMYRLLLPAVSHSSLAAMGFLPYILALPLGAALARRGYRLLGSSCLPLVGLACLLLLAWPKTAAIQVVAYLVVLIGLAWADLYLWLTLLELAGRGFYAPLGLGLGLCVLTVTAAGMLTDLVPWEPASTPLPMPFIAVALILILTPLAAPRLFFGSQTTGILGAEPGTRVAACIDPADAQLTRTEKEILSLILSGRKNKEIAEILNISPNTVKFHIRNILRKTKCRSKNDLRKVLGAFQNTTSVKALDPAAKNPSCDATS